MEQGWDPEVKRYFLKILSTISYGLMWMMAVVTGGIYLRLGWRNERPVIFMILFYVAAIVTLILLLRYFIRLWKN